MDTAQDWQAMRAELAAAREEAREAGQRPFNTPEWWRRETRGCDGFECGAKRPLHSLVVVQRGGAGGR
jgi:hypothetical protein